MLQQLGGTDANFLYMETVETPMHVGSLYLYELPPGYSGDFYEDFKAQIAQRMHLFPILTRKLAQLPFDLDAPLWVPDEEVDLDYHVRRHTVPKPGRFDQLEELVGRLHSHLLDRSRPLWEIYIIDGIGEGRVAEYAKFHHAGFDGAAAMAFVQSLYDFSPVPRPIPPPLDAGKHEEQIDPVKLMGLIYANAWRQYLRAMQTIPDFLKAWTKLALPDPQTLKLEPPEWPHLAPSTLLNVAVTSQRTYAARTVSLKDIKWIAKTAGTTVNDVVMSICSAALRRYLRTKHDLPMESLTAFVPVSLREMGNTEMNNQVFGMICNLATNVANPRKRLLAIHDATQKAKRLTDTIKSVVTGILSPWGMPFLAHGLMDILGHYRLADHTRPLANLTISNNIGPAMPMYLAGAKVLSIYPMSIPTHGSALNITVQSYGDNLDIGLTACRRALPDVRKLGDDIVDALAELKTDVARAAAREARATEAAGGHTGAPRAKKPRAAKAVRSKRVVPAPGPAPKQPLPAKPEEAGGDAKITETRAEPVLPRIAVRSSSTVEAPQNVAVEGLKDAFVANALGEHPGMTVSAEGARANPPLPAKRK